MSLRGVAKISKISHQTVRHYISLNEEKDDPIKPYKTIRRLYLKDETKKRREEFCTHDIRHEWKSVC